jgi:hypothetical protein
MDARLRIPAKLQDMRASKLWWILLFCMLLVIVGASAAIAAALVPNSDPVAKDNGYRVHKGEILKRSAPAVLGNDSDPDGDRLSAARASSPRHGKLTLRSNGSFVYTPKEGYHGMDSFTYAASDGNGGTDTARVEITVWPVIKPVLARNDLFQTKEDVTLNHQAPGVLRNDAEVEGRRLSAQKVSGPSHGTLNLDPHGSFVYTPSPDFNGEDSFVYRASDRTGLADKGTVTIAVGAVNDPPAFSGAASNTSQTIDEGTGLAALEATDVDGDTLTFERTGGSLPQGITLNNGGTFSGTAGGRSAGNYTANVEVSDGNGGSDATDLATTVNQVDVSPEAAADPVSTDEDTPKTLTLSATDEDSDNLTFSTSSPGHGSLGTVSAPNCSTTAGTASCTATVEYTPDADYYGPDSFTYKANDGNSDSNQATVDITVNAVNDAPAANDDTKTTPENTPLDFPASDLFANDTKGATNEDGQTLSVTEVKNAQHGTVSLDNSAQITFTPEADYNGPASFEYTVRDDGQSNGVDDFKSDTGTVDVSVSPVNSKPTASATPSGLDIDEDAAAQTITLSGSDAETGAANLLFTITEAPAHGVLKKDTTVLTNGDTFVGNPTDVTYKPDADYNGSDPFSFKVTDRGDPDNCGAPGPSCDAAKDSDTQTVPITVNPVNDAPSFDLGSDQTVVNTAGAQTVLGFATSISSGPPDESGQTLTFALTNDDNSLFSVQPDIDEATGDLTYTPDPSASGTATVTVELKDDGGTATSGQDTTTKTFKITVKLPNSPPAAAGQSVSTDEDVAKTITLSADDPDGDAVTSFSISDGPAHGSLGSIGSINCDSQTPNHCTADVSYTGNTDYNGPDQFKFTASDAQATGAAATVDITVNSVNDSPVLANVEGGALAYTENDAPKAITSALTVSDADNPNLTGAKIAITANYQSSQDVLAFTNQNGISGSWDAATGTLTLTGQASLADYQAALRSVTYKNTSENPSTAVRTVSFTADDGGAQNHASNSQTRQISVTAVNDAPSLAGIEGTAVDYVESVNSPPSESQLTNSLTASDVDNANLSGATVQLTTACQSGEDVLTFTNQNGITGSYVAGTCTLSLSGSASPANYQTALRSIKYRNTSDTPNTTTRTVTFKVDDGQAQNHESNTQMRDITVTASNDSPTAGNETFNGAIHNTSFVVDDPSDPAQSVSGAKKTITGDILANDSDPETPGSVSVVTNTNVTSTNGGKVAIESDGDFTYVSDPADNCSPNSDSFKYTLTDNDPGGAQTAQGTVTINLSGCVWYVDNDPATAGNAGTSTDPFDALSSAEAKSAANQTVFIFKGSGSYTGGYSLDANERLIGEAANLVVGSDTLYTGDPTKRPTITDNNDDVVALDDANEVRGLELDPQGTGGGIAGATGDTGGATIADVRIIDNGTPGTQPGLELDSTTGTFNISNLTVSTSGATGVRLNNAGTTNFLPAGTISITTSGAKALDATGALATPTNMGSGSVFDDITVTGSGAGGVSMSGTTGTTTFGDGTGTDLNLTTTSGTAPAFGLSNAGSIAVGSAGVDNVSANGGPAIDVTGTPGASLEFDDVDSTNTIDGINLAGLVGGTFSATSGDITNASGIAFDLDGGSGAVTYPGNLGNGTGQAAEITGRTGGAVTLSGQIADTNDNGGGITVGGTGALGNTGGSTTFSNASKVLNTGTSNAVVMDNNTNHTIDFTNGGLDIDTTSGAGLSATGGGTVTVGTGANPNTIDSTTTGTALNVANTTIGSNGLTFRSISAGPASGSGPTNGIVLNNTGASGGLTVTGDGGASSNNSGGTIQRTSGEGVSLTSTADVHLGYMNITNNLGDGIGGSGINGLVLTRDNITGNGNDAATDESGVNITQLTGTNAAGPHPTSITNTTISNNNEFEIQITNNSGTLADLTMSGNTISSNGLPINGNTSSPHGNLFNFLALGTANMTLNVTGGSFTGNWNPASPPATITATAVQCDHSGTGGTMTCNISGATFTNNNVGPQGSVAGNGQMVVNFTGNTITGTRSHGINFFADANPGTKSITGVVQNNTVGTLNVANSGSEVGFPIRVQNEGAVPVTLLISGNTIQESSIGGINVNHGISNNTISLGGQQTSVTITSNIVRKMTNSRGITVNNNSDSNGGEGTVCSNISGNSFANIAGQAGDGSVMRIGTAAGTTHKVTQASKAALAAANGVTDAQVFEGGIGTPTYNQPACPTP